MFVVQANRLAEEKFATSKEQKAALSEEEKAKQQQKPIATKAVPGTPW